MGKVSHQKRTRSMINISKQRVDGKHVIRGYTTNMYSYAQLIDPEGKTILSLSTRSADVKQDGVHTGGVAAAKTLGEKVAKAIKAKGIKSAIYCRGRKTFTGRIKGIADGIRMAKCVDIG